MACECFSGEMFGAGSMGRCCNGTIAVIALASLPSLQCAFVVAVEVPLQLLRCCCCRCCAGIVAIVVLALSHHCASSPTLFITEPEKVGIKLE